MFVDVAVVRCVVIVDWISAQSKCHSPMGVWVWCVHFANINAATKFDVYAPGHHADCTMRSMAAISAIRTYARTHDT